MISYRQVDIDKCVSVLISTYLMILYFMENINPMLKKHGFFHLKSMNYYFKKKKLKEIYNREIFNSFYCQNMQKRI